MTAHSEFDFYNIMHFAFVLGVLFLLLNLIFNVQVIFLGTFKKEY